MVREYYVIAPSRIARAHEGLKGGFHKRPIFRVGSCVWVNNDLIAVEKSRDNYAERVLKSKLS